MTQQLSKYDLLSNMNNKDLIRYNFEILKVADMLYFLLDHHISMLRDINNFKGSLIMLKIKAACWARFDIKLFLYFYYL